MIPVIWAKCFNLKPDCSLASFPAFIITERMDFYLFFYFFKEEPQVLVEMTLSILFCNLHALNKWSIALTVFVQCCVNILAWILWFIVLRHIVTDCESLRGPITILHSSSNWCLIVSRMYLNELLMFLFNLTGKED